MYTLLTLLICCGMCFTNSAVSIEKAAVSGQQMYVENTATGHHPHHKSGSRKKKSGKKGREHKKVAKPRCSPELADQIVMGTIQLPHESTLAAPSAPIEDTQYSYSVVMDSPNRTVVTIKFKNNIKPDASAVVGALVYHKKQAAQSPYYWICETKNDLDESQHANTICVVIDNPEPSHVTVESFKFAIVQ